MAKPLTTPPPSSAVARLLDLKAAARATAPIEPLNVSQTAPIEQTVQNDSSIAFHPGPTAKKIDPPKRELVLTPETDAVLAKLVELYRQTTGTRLTTSHVARAILKGVHHCMHYLEREARHLPPMNLPSNAKGRELERERFEARLADAFIAGIRAAPALDREF